VPLIPKGKLFNPSMLEEAVEYRHSKSHCIETNTQNTILTNYNECAFLKRLNFETFFRAPFFLSQQKEA
jgi:hypothetical protein